MAREKFVNYDEELLLPPRIEDWVGPRHLARFVREFVEMLDLPSLGFVSSAKTTGRIGFSPKTLLSAWVYGYLTKQKSTRGLERACQSDMGAIWLTGNLQPDHSTLGNFFKVHQMEFKKLLKESALLGCRMGLVDLSFVALDGTKLRASTCGKGAIHAKDLKIGLEALDAEIEAYIQQIESMPESPDEKLPESLVDRQRLRDAMSEDLAELKKLGASQLSPVDPDARMMQTRHGLRLSYNAQAAVDGDSGIVLACSVSLDANDANLMDRVLDELESNIGMSPDLTAVDSGYFSAHQLQIAQEKQRAVAVSMKGREPAVFEPLHSWYFAHDTRQNMCVCPIGGELSYYGKAEARKGKDPVTRYRCQDFQFCPNAQICSKDPKGRMVEIGKYRESAIRLWYQQKNNEHRYHMKRRGATVERVFGHVKRNLELRQLEHRGLETVEAVWSTALCATNLRTIFKTWSSA